MLLAFDHSPSTAGKPNRGALCRCANRSFVCSICRTTTELGLNHNLGPLKGFFAQPICDAAKHMAGIWGRNFPDQEPQLLALPQNVNTPGSVQYIYDEYQRLRAELERRTGQAIPNDAIRNSVRIYNEARRLQRELYRIKRDDPARLSTVEAYLLIRAGIRMRREEHVEVLQQALELIAERPVYAMDKPRVIFLGGFCEQPPLEMLEAIEDTCFIVGDDLLVGQRWIVEDVSEFGRIQSGRSRKPMSTGLHQVLSSSTPVSRRLEQ